MPKWNPCKRRVFIKKLVKLGFNMPEPGGRHFYIPKSISENANWQRMVFIVVEFMCLPDIEPQVLR
ncbi:MAG: hypothetical protein FIB07_02395 [Candidatus Methanoperedens sp.]|nr:hypothetical protein [Candidatus Methanoperedens sp.]